MKNQGNSQQHIIIGLIILLCTVLGIRFYKQLKLNSTFVQSTGKVIKLNSGGPSGSIHFTFPENKVSRLDNTMTISWPSCRKAITKHMGKLQTVRFPVVFEKSSPDNAEILIFKDQYEKFNIKIPEELVEIVNELSKCKQ